MHQYLYAEQDFAVRHPIALRAPPGAPFDYVFRDWDVEVKGITYTVYDGGEQRRRGRAFIDMGAHRAFKSGRAHYCFVIYNGETREIWLTWMQVQRLIWSYKTFHRRDKGQPECVKLGLRRIEEEARKHV